MKLFNDLPQRLSRLLSFGVLVAVTGLTLNVGCTDSKTDADKSETFKKAAPDPLKILIVGDTGIGAKLKRQWKSRRDGELTIVDRSVDQWSEQAFAIGADVDLVVYPTAFVGELVESKKIEPLEHSVWSSNQIDKESFLDHYGRSIVRYGNETTGLPLGNPHFAMIYNQANFPSPLPKTWEGLSESLISSRRKIELPLAAGWAGHAFVCRAASSARSAGSFSVLFDRATMVPQITAPVFVESLESLHQMASDESLQSTPTDAFRAVVNGDAVAALGWPAASVESSGGGSAAAVARGTYSIVAVPKSDRAYDFRRQQWKTRTANEDSNVESIGFSGLTMSIVADNRHEYSVLEFVKWFSDPKITLSVISDSQLTGPVRVSHLGNIGRWTGEDMSFDLADDYASVIREIHQRDLVVLFPRIPGSHRYYAALDAGVRRAVAGEQSPRQALAAVAQQWEEITDSIGREKQIQAMRHESGF